MDTVSFTKFVCPNRTGFEATCRQLIGELVQNQEGWVTLQSLMPALEALPERKHPLRKAISASICHGFRDVDLGSKPYLQKRVDRGCTSFKYVK